MKTLQLAGIQSCQIFNQLKRCASKNAVLRLIERTPPPGGGFLFTMFPNQKPRGSGPPLKNHPQNSSILGMDIHVGSSSSGSFVSKPPNKETTPGGGGSFDQGAIKNVASLNPWRQDAKWRKTPTDSTVTEPNYVQIPTFLHISRAREQERIRIY